MVIEYIKQELASFSDFIKWCGAVDANYFLYDGKRCYVYGSFTDTVTMIYYVDYKIPKNHQFVAYNHYKNKYDFVDVPVSAGDIVNVAIIYIKEWCLEE